ncbi:MAG: heme exporter protein CcmB [Deltaproteobacteria bacterium]|jgi:heme exporter protein B|nr:heme exporter protein CcmB [Deltaproteobacteria bacterium]
MLKATQAIARKDLTLTLARGGGLGQALLLGLLLVFMFSLAQEAGERAGPQGAATVFWLASAFCQVLVFNSLYGLEEVNGARQGLALLPCPAPAIWMGKALAGLALMLPAQAVFAFATVVFLGQDAAGDWRWALGILLLTDIGMALLGSLLGALAQGQAAKESVLSIVLFPLLAPLLMAGIRVGTGFFAGRAAQDAAQWLGLAAAFDAVFAAAGLVLFAYIYTGDE